VSESRDFDRLLARALRDPPLDPIPLDFAARTAELAKREDERAAHAHAPDDRLEAWLQNGLIALLAVTAIASLAVLASAWFRAAAAAVAQSRDSGTLWGVAILACVALTWALERWQERARAARGAARPPRA
jgi:hypothetical protein